ncbi:reverse transcriptase domain-containing protein, partial [Rhodovarius sp.]|uniref:reverse transcriptase domain-containing protein n=1 Tax=Rhodovarius sp. TaxID=2972673 RepID=UPI00334153DA
MVRKPDGGWRPCGDYRRLNLLTKPDKYPLPNMADFSGRLDGCQVFSKLDLRKGYLQVPVRPSDVAKTAIITPFGLWEFLRMPFGLKNAGMTFQRLMDRVLQGLDFVFVYLDDILIASKDMASHAVHLREVLSRLQEHGLVLNVDKCSFGQPTVEFLGHQVSGQGFRPLATNISALSSFPRPTTVRDLQGFLGLVNFYRPFFPAAAKILRPLTEALKGGPACSSPVSWSPEMESAFLTAKATLSSSASLRFPAENCDLVLAVDASATHVGAALQQQRPCSPAWEPLGFFSRKLDTAQQKYSAFDRELLAAYEAIRHFRHLLEGRCFTIWTDHKPLVSALHRISEPWTARQQRHLSYLAEFTPTLVHIPGSSNVVADTLSRPPAPPATVAEVAATSPPAAASIDLKALAAAQATCEATQSLLASPQSLSIQQQSLEDVSLYCDVSAGRLRPIVPLPFRPQVFHQIHDLGHPGTRATQRLVTSRFVWKGMGKDIAAWCRDCQHCGRGKVTGKMATPPAAISVPS